MSVIAVAGASGGVGQAIVERLAQEPKYQVLAFSRKVRRTQRSASSRALLLTYKKASTHPLPHVQTVQLNYEDVPSMTETLEALNVQTIISTIVLVSEETNRAQLNLIDAAGASAKTKRFIPSEFLFIQPAA